MLRFYQTFASRDISTEMENCVTSLIESSGGFSMLNVFVISWVFPFTDRSGSAKETKIDSPEEEDVFFVRKMR